MAKPTTQYSYTPIESEFANSMKAYRDTAGNMFKFLSEYDDPVPNLVRAKENIVQGVGLPGALLGAYALGNKPKKGKSRLPGVVGAVGGAYLGKTLYDFAANNENTKQYITDFTNFVDKHTGGIGGQYVPMAAQALGGLLGYGLLKQSNYNMYKYAANGNPFLKYLLAGGAAAGATTGGVIAYDEYQDIKNKARTTLDQVNNTLKQYQDTANQINTITLPALNTTINDVNKSVNDTASEYGKLAKDGQETLDDINKNVNDKLPMILALGGIGLGVGVPLATYLAKKNKSKKKNKSETIN